MKFGRKMDRFLAALGLAYHLKSRLFQQLPQETARYRVVIRYQNAGRLLHVFLTILVPGVSIGRAKPRLLNILQGVQQSVGNR